jgi:hypothetical protein
MNHLPESTLDDYLMQRVSQYRAARVEEHLYGCRECLERLLEVTRKKSSRRPKRHARLKYPLKFGHIPYARSRGLG